jgi:hypothetical protein
MEVIKFKNVKRLYRDCLKTANFLSSQQPNLVMVDKTKAMIRQEFKKNMFEKDPAKIQQCINRALRGMNSYLYARAKIEKNEHPFSKKK